MTTLLLVLTAMNSVLRLKNISFHFQEVIIIEMTMVVNVILDVNMILHSMEMSLTSWHASSWSLKILT